MRIKELLQSKFSKDTIWLMLAQGLTLLSGFFITIHISLHYGIQELGYFHQSLAFYMILMTLFGFGLNNTLIKKTAVQSSKLIDEARYLATTLSVTFVINLSLSSICLLFLNLNEGLLSSPELTQLVKINLLALPFFGLNKNFGAYYSGQRNQRKVAVIRSVRWILLAGSVLLCSILNYPLEVLMYAFLITETILLSYNLLSNSTIFKFRPSLKLAKEVVLFGLGSYISEITSIVNASADVIIIGYLLSAEDAGNYSFIIYFVKTIYIFPGILMQNVSPIISNHWARNSIPELNKKLSELRNINSTILTVQLIGLTMLFIVLNLWFRNNTIVILPFCISIIGSYFFALISWGGSILIMTGKLRANFYRTLLVLVISILSIFLFTSLFGFIGSAIAISLNGIASFFLLRTFIHQNTGIKLA